MNIYSIEDVVMFNCLFFFSCYKDSASLERVRREIEARSKSMKNKLTGQV